MPYELTGKIIELFPIEQKSERFRKREFVVEKTETTGDRSFTDFVKFQATNDKCELLNGMKIGDEVKVTFNIKGNRWEGRDGQVSYFTNLDAWRVEAASGASQGGGNYGGGGSSQQPSYGGDSGPQTPPPAADDYEDDLPF